MEYASAEILWSNLPISYNQERRLLVEELTRLQGKTVVPFMNAIAFEIAGRVDADALERSLKAIVSRHPAFRTAFKPMFGDSYGDRVAMLRRAGMTGVLLAPVYSQDVYREAEVRVTVRHVDDVQTHSAIAALLEGEYKSIRHHDEPTGLRADVLLGAADKAIVFVPIPQLVCDSESVRILIRDLYRLYLSIVSGQSEYSTETPSHYLELLSAEQRNLHNGSYAEALGHWEEQWNANIAYQLDAADVPGTIPSAVPINLRGSVAFDGGFVTLSPDERTLLDAGLKASNTSLRTLALTAFAVAIRNIASKPRAVFWTTFANRLNRQAEGEIGWFANRHLVGVDLSDDPCVEDLLRRMSLTLAEADRYAGLPLAVLWRRKGVCLAKGLRLACDVEVLDAPLGVVASHTNLIPLSLSGRVTFDNHLHVNVFRRPGGLISLHASYATNVFTADAVTTWLAMYKDLLVRLSGSPRCRLSESSLRGCEAVA